MKRRLWFLVTLVGLSPSSRLTSQSIPNATSTATVAADPRDVASADAIITALYDANTILVDRSATQIAFARCSYPGLGSCRHSDRRTAGL
jgi:hypothetical protein